MSDPPAPSTTCVTVSSRTVPGWLSITAILGTLVIVALAASVVSPVHLAAVLGLGGALALLRWPPAGLVGLVIAAMVVPFAVGTGTQTSLNAAILVVPILAGLWLLEMLALRRVQLPRSQTVLPLFALCAVALISFLAGVEPWLLFAQTAPFRTQLGGLAIFLVSAAAFLLAADRLRDERWLVLVVWVFLAIGALYVMGRIVPEIGRWTGRLVAPGANGSLFWVWLVALAFSQAAFNRSMWLPLRLILGAILVATFYVALSKGSGWTSGWVPALAAVLVALWAGAPRLGLLATFFLGGSAAWNGPDTMAFLMAGDNQYSLDTRVEAWRLLGEIVQVSPVIGLGPSNYYWYTPIFNVMGYYVSFNSHNQYVDLVAQTGLLGLVCFLWFVWEVGRAGMRLHGLPQSAFRRAYVLGAVGGLAGTLVAGMLGDWVIPFAYNVGFQGFRASVLGWLFLGGLVALEQPPRDRIRGS